MLLCSSVLNIKMRYNVADFLSSSALRRALSRKAKRYELFSGTPDVQNFRCLDSQNGLLNSTSGGGLVK
jgi:hypothetical protein